jgi:hypothetical protein
MKNIVTLQHGLIYMTLALLTYAVAIGSSLGCSQARVVPNAVSRMHRAWHQSTGLNVLIYITTHLSDAHVYYLKTCWPSMIANSQLFRRADFSMFVTTSSAKHLNTSLIESLFTSVNFKLHIRPNPGYQRGAMLAMTEAYKLDWFEHYDWVIRLNPDVFIRNETFLLHRLRDPAISGVFVDCTQKVCESETNCSGRLIHTDFMAFRPNAIERNAFQNANDSNAESQATRALDRIIEAKMDSWVTDVGVFRGACRVRGENSPVIHEHNASLVYPACLHWNS